MERIEKISSHAGWHKGPWLVDICPGCGKKFLVPKRDYYQCNQCADRAEGKGGEEDWMLGNY
jgi:hypothetical protein